MLSDLLEHALRPGDRMGGHIVQGHVDATGTLLARHHEERWDVLEISVPDELMGYVAVKGSIAIDGISLTVVDVVDSAGSEGIGGRVTVSLIPETLRRTTLGLTQVGEAVNLEVDVMAKYIARYLSRYAPSGVSGSGD